MPPPIIADGHFRLGKFKSPKNTNESNGGWWRIHSFIFDITRLKSLTLAVGVRYTHTMVKFAIGILRIAYSTLPWDPLETNSASGVRSFRMY